MNFLKKVFQKQRLEKVFTPTTVAKINYVSRDGLEDEMTKNLQIPGRQIIVYGHSGSGKTTLIKRILYETKTNYIKSHCESVTTFNDLLLNAFDGLNRFYVSTKKYERGYKRSFALKLDYSSIASEISEKYGAEMQRIVPPQLTIQKLAQFLGDIHAVWIIEDFHKVCDDEKRRIADTLKIFIDEANSYSDVKIVCIGAVDTARELVNFDSNLSPRVVELQVPMLSDDEIKTIITRGCELMNVTMTDQLIEKLVYYSNNIGSLVHQMCYDICYKNNVKKTKFKKQIINDDKFIAAVKSYITANSDTLKSIYESKVKNQLAWYMLKTIVTKGKNGISYEEIKTRINYKGRNYSDEDIENKLQELKSPQCNIVRQNTDSGKYFISTPFWEAFLKMQLALEKNNSNKAHKERKQQFLFKNVQDIDTDIFKLYMEFMKNYKLLSK